MRTLVGAADPDPVPHPTATMTWTWRPTANTTAGSTFAVVDFTANVWVAAAPAQSYRASAHVGRPVPELAD